jgi:tRNA uridine 5-carboxymethylaminomethyl modification enzyme
VQIDKDLYSLYAEQIISFIPNISVIREKVIELKNGINGFEIITNEECYLSSKIIMTVGTFLNGKLHTGSQQTVGGRHGCDASSGLDSLMAEIKTRPYRFKTGTPQELIKARLIIQS